jgi:hypothetical protein
MRRLPDKLLALLLSLLLGLAPLQGVMGMPGGSPDLQTAPQQPAHNHDHDPLSGEIAKSSPCTHCLSHDCCQGQAGGSASNHCSGCLAALPVAMSPVAMTSDNLTYPLIQVRYTNRLPSSILRPPRV